MEVSAEMGGGDAGRKEGEVGMKPPLCSGQPSGRIGRTGKGRREERWRRHNGERYVGGVKRDEIGGRVERAEDRAG